MTRSADSGTRRSARVRCAIYTRKSSEEGLEQEFNSLQAQREACEAFISSQRHEGWVCLPACYDDGGFSGATIDRPALQRLLADITARRVDIVVVYKIDRLTRSLADFAKIVEILDAEERVICFGYAAVQHDDVDGSLDAERTAVLCAIRA
jgi:site-specific DNA recombinase